MRKELLIHTISFLVLFVLASLVKGWLDLNHLPFWLGGIMGTILPDVDHVIYVYFLKPYELTSQRVVYTLQKGDLLRTWQLLASTRNERTNLILHSTIFQGVFVVLAFLVLTSSVSLLGRGMVLAFLLHLTIDQLVDYFSVRNLNNWTAKLNLLLDNTQTILYLAVSSAIVLLFSFLM